MSEVIETTEDPTKRRKATLLLAEILKLADYYLPASGSANLQLLPDLFAEADEMGEQGVVAGRIIYQIDSVNRTLQRSGLASKTQVSSASAMVSAPRNHDLNGVSGEAAKARMSVDMDELRFRSILLETQVLTTANYLKWRICPRKGSAKSGPGRNF